MCGFIDEEGLLITITLASYYLKRFIFTNTSAYMRRSIFRSAFTTTCRVTYLQLNYRVGKMSMKQEEQIRVRRESGDVENKRYRELDMSR